MSSPSASTIAELRPFPNAKAPPAAEAPLPPAPDEVAATVPAGKKRSARSFFLPIILLVLLGGGAWYGYDYWTDGRFLISTDDAYVQADMAFVSPKISGYIDHVEVVENQKVRAGEPLFVVDDGDYRIAAEQAQAEITTLGKTLERIDAQIVAAQAALQQAGAQKGSACRRQCGAYGKSRRAAS